jgi:ribosomal protein L7Ae-like RNA K-turn-binding protein
MSCTRQSSVSYDLQLDNYGDINCVRIFYFPAVHQIRASRVLPPNEGGAGGLVVGGRTSLCIDSPYVLSFTGYSIQLQGDGTKKHTASTVVHVTADSSVSSLSTSTLLGQNSDELLDECGRLFCPEPGTKEADLLGFVRCVDGEKGLDGPTEVPVGHGNRKCLLTNPRGVPLGESQRVHCDTMLPQSQKYPPGFYTSRVPLTLQQEHPSPFVETRPSVECGRLPIQKSGGPVSWAMRLGVMAKSRLMSFEAARASQDELPHDLLQRAQAPAEETDPEDLVGLGGSYQPYCNQIITPALNEVTSAALEKLRGIQQQIEAEHMAKPGATKATSPRKFFCSLKEVSKVVRFCKMLIIAPDVKPSLTAHVKPVKMLHALIDDAKLANVPYIFALSRRGIGQIFGKDKSMSIMALMDLDAVREESEKMLEEAAKGRAMWVAKSSSVQ